MAFPIVPRRRSGSAGNPTSLNLGELAVNTHDGSLYLGTDVGVVQIGIPVAAGTEETVWTANGSASQFAPINGYNGTDVGGYLVTVQGIQQPFTVSADNGGTLVFDFTPPTGSVIRARSVTQAMGGGGGSGVPATDVQVFTTDGEWTKPAGAKSVNVVCVGGGQGGGGGGTGDGSEYPGAGGNGGAGGKYTERTINAADLPSTVTITVGVGGAGAAAGVLPNGAVGGNSLFGNFAKSSGGGNGTLGQWGPEAGGDGGVGDAPGSAGASGFAPGGGGGGHGWATVDAYEYAIGGESVIGNGGNGGTAWTNKSDNDGKPGTGYGGGGGGGGAHSVASPYYIGDGGNGAPGVVIVTTYF